jgi:hypothetical protein
MVKPSVFVGSSSEALDFPRAVQYQLNPDAEVTIWNELPFKPGQYTLEALLNALERFDFAVFVFSPDDVVVSRGIQSYAPRDNVILELGLFMGRLGRARAFVLHQANANIMMLSDLSGLTTVTYEWPNRDGNPIPAVGPACTMIRGAIKDLGIFEGNFKQLREVKEEVKEQELKLSKQQEIINQLVIFSMSHSIYEKLRHLYYCKRQDGEYIYRENYEDTDRREFFFLRDNGYLASAQGGYFDPGPHLIGQNLVPLVELTPIGNFYIEQREQLEQRLRNKGLESV